MAYWFIDSAASGANNGTSKADAWQTLSAFVDANLAFGDTLNIEGSFAGESILIDTHGILINAGGAIIDGAGLSPAINWLIKTTGDYVTLNGGTWFGCIGTGLNGQNIFLERGDFCEVSNVNSHSSSFGGLLARSVRAFYIHDCDVSDNDVKGITVAGDTDIPVGTIDPNIVNIRIEDNITDRNGRFGIQSGGGNGRLTGRKNRISGNQMAGNGTGLCLEDAYDFEVYKNIFDRNDLVGETGARQTEIRINGGTGNDIHDNTFLDKVAAAEVFEFNNSDSMPNNNLIRHNKINVSELVTAVYRIAILGTDGNKFIGNDVIMPLGSNVRGTSVCQATNGEIIGNTFIGGRESILLNPVTAVPISVTDWVLNENTFDGPNIIGIMSGSGATVDANIAGNRYRNMPVNWVQLGGTIYRDPLWPTDPIQDKDLTYRVDDPNYAGPVTGSFLARNYTQSPSAVNPGAGDGFTQADRDTVDAIETNTIEILDETSLILISLARSTPTNDMPPDDSSLFIIRGQAYDDISKAAYSWDAGRDIDGEDCYLTFRFTDDETNDTSLVQFPAVGVGQIAKFILDSEATKALPIPCDGEPLVFDVFVKFTATSYLQIGNGTAIVSESVTRPPVA